MKKTISLLLLLSLFFVQKTHAQCGTIMVSSTNNIHPDTITNIPVANRNQAYSGIIQLFCPSTLSNLSISSIAGLPAGFSYITSPANGIITAGNSGCIIIQASFVTNPAGVYPLVLNLMVNGMFPATVNGYKIVVPAITLSATALIGSTTSAGNVQLNRIGKTLNNQQTNAAIYRHLQVLPGNQIGAVWTSSTDGSPFLNRGTAYNRLTGTTWVNGDTAISRIESERAGFPSYAYNSGTNEEVILAHKTPTTGYWGGFVMSRRTAGTNNAWSQSTVLDTTFNVPGVLWCRTAISNNLLHVVARYTDSSAGQPVNVFKNGVRSPVVYSRFNFANNTWEVKNTPIPGYNNSRYAYGYADAYAIDANGSNVAVLIGGLNQDVSLFRSTNNGSSWIKTVVDSFKYAPYPIDANVLMPDTPYTNDGALSVLIDNTGKVHCFWPKARVLDLDITDNFYSYFPTQIELNYWNTSRVYGNKSVVGSAIDTDNDNNYSIIMGPNRYGNTSSVTMPSSGLSSDGKLFCTYSAQSEYNDDGLQSFRDIHLISSSDGGDNWSFPINITEWMGPGVECGFPSMARTVTNKIHLTFSKSDVPGPNAAGEWDMQYLGIDTNALSASGFTVAPSVTNSYAISDTIICKGKTINTNLINCKLWQDTNLVVSNGVNSFTPELTKTYTIRSNTNIAIRTFTIAVTDSLQPIRTIGSAAMNICGLTSNFALGASTAYTGPKTMSWFRNDTLIKTGTLIDSFNFPGVYRLTIANNFGCKSSLTYSVNRINNVFNPNFSSNRQNASSPPFDFTFANQTPSLSSYDYTWSWGDGSKDTINNSIVFKTYLANGSYTVKLVAKDKFTGCSDSVTKTNYISCSGLLPLNFTSFKTQPSCFGSSNGGLAILASGGISPYQYKIDSGTYQSANSFSNLGAKVYLISVKDANNTVYSRLDTLTNPAAISAGSINGATSALVNSSYSYAIAAQSGASYAWSVVNGSITSGVGTNNIQVLWGSTAGQGKVILVFSKNGCSVSDTLLVNINALPLSMSTTKTQPTCAGSNNGSISVSAAGGVAPYQYRINNGVYQSNQVFSNLSAGVYAVYVKDANNTELSKIDTIVNPAPLSIGGITGETLVGVGTTKAYQVTAQTGASYAWNIINGTLLSGNGTNIVQVQWASLAGIGKVIITMNKNACIGSDTIDIIISNSVPLSMSTTKENITCSSLGKITVNATGGSTPYQYALNAGPFQTSNVFSGLSAGTYLVQVKDHAGALLEKYDTLLNISQPVIAGVINGPISVPTLALSTYIAGQQNGVNYFWTVLGGVLASGQGTNILQVSWSTTPTQGKLTLKVSNASGCSDSSILNVSVGSNSIANLNQNDFRLFPNPAAEQITIQSNNSFNGAQVQLVDMLGRIVLEANVNTTDTKFQLPLSNIKPGSYMVLINKNQETARIKLIIE
jgi:hypothetical protein